MIRATKGDEMPKFELPVELLSNDIREWSKFAKCKGEDVEHWFADVIAGREAKIAVIQAKNVCERCIVRNQCLEYAQKHNEEFGIWGGLTARERGYGRHARRKKRG